MLLSYATAQRDLQRFVDYDHASIPCLWLRLGGSE
jgi:hypothetical protein